jgi:general secretion pathway protein K
VGVQPPAPSVARRGRRKGERGVALIIVVISIAILTAVATEFIYSSTVDLRMAANQRDDIRAHYLARSGIGMSRLLLSFQSQIDNLQLPPGIGELLGMAPGAEGSPALKIDLWKLARVDCYMLQGLVTSGQGREERRDSRRAPPPSEVDGLSPPEGQRDFGGFTGCFDVRIESENEKINLHGLMTPGSGAFERAMALIGDEKYEFLFEGMDSNRVEVTPTELLIHINDWADEDQVGAALDLSGVTARLIAGFSDENHGYSRYETRYQAKNAEFDSLDELFMVHGMNDRRMDAFRERFTVYLNKNEGMNVNTADTLSLVSIIFSVADLRDASTRAALQNPVSISQVLQTIQQAKMISALGFSTKDFANLLQLQGIKVRPEVLSGGPSSGITDKNTVFTLKATGEAGSIKKNVTAVVNMKDRSANGGMGRLMYWREE